MTPASNAHALLADDGVIFVVIDDSALLWLDMLMDRVLGADRFIATCTWQKRYSRENRGAIGDAHAELFKQRRTAFRPVRPLSCPAARVERGVRDRFKACRDTS